ncbi:transcription termination factor NusA [Lignipirellula cremea]|uniref:Transcription termination/antitermination protein NusA n=1 Tax=Lignipirellula cremea TaxID=2528010 RepID=A0A518DQW1_9BACT|nr:transcription termination factor NusA [Lignipirellula cremea]QDU94228.1 hypothetical protein Pla8534_20160 [Lignipirellula cremea]
MKPNELLRIVDALHREKNIDKEVVFQAIESALVSAARKHSGEDSEISFVIDRETGELAGVIDGEDVDFEETIGRIGAQTAKQVIIQKVREAERDALLDQFQELVGQLVNGVVLRAEPAAAIVQIENVEALLPRSEQIPGESHHVNERVRAVVFEVKPQGSRVKVVLSRTRPQLVQRLFEMEIPEIADGVIEINAMAREPGYRSKVAVSSSDQRVDCVGACVGVRGNRIKNIVDELSGERIDIVRYSDDARDLITNALQPASVDEVILCQMMGRAIVLVQEDQLSLAIGRRGQNVRLASKLCGWDIEIMTHEELEDRIDVAIVGFSQLDGVDEELANRLVGEGYLSYDDLSVIEPSDLMEMGSLTMEQAEAIAEQAEVKALAAEENAAAERQRQREKAQLQEQYETARRHEAAMLARQAEASGDPAAPADAAEEGAVEEGAVEEGAVEEGAVEEGAVEEGAVEETADADGATEPAASGDAEAGKSEDSAAPPVETSGEVSDTNESPAKDSVPSPGGDDEPTEETEVESKQT